MMRLEQKHMLFGSFVLLLLLTGCGNNAGSGSNSPAGQPDPSSTPLPPTSAVSLQMDARAYTVGSTISVTISNQSQQTILLTDHKTNCSVLLVERQSAGSWQPVAACKLMIATRTHPLQAGAIFVVKLATTAGQWPAGTYRVTLDYLSDSTPGSGTPHTVVSNQFGMSS